MQTLAIAVTAVAIWAASVHFYAKKLGLRSVWTATLHPSMGLTFESLLRLLWENRFQVSFLYWHRLLLLTIKSLINSILAYVEERKFGVIIRKTRILNDPVFIIGHWRSGTTHLHNLMAQDTELFAYPTTLQCFNPWAFLTFEKLLTRQARFFLPKTRPMDNVAFGPETPQEDEFATCIICGVSPQNGDVFPQNYKKYYKALTFKETSLAENATWRQGFSYFLKKLTIRYGAEKRLLLKSPHHTARIRTLLQMYPDAKFVHIRRDPYTVYQSTKHLMDTLYSLSYLQVPPLHEQDDIAINRYKEMYDRYFEDIKMLKPEQLIEIDYETLTQSPVSEMERIYTQLQLPGWNKAKSKIEQYAKPQMNFSKNKHAQIPASIIARINTACARVFKEWGYPMRNPNESKAATQ